MTDLLDRQSAPGARPRGRGPSTLEMAIVVGGVVGALARAGLDRALPAGGHEWPWATLTANLVGTMLLGYFATRLQERLPPSTFRRPLLGTGFCGSLTTFSTFQIELIRLVRSGHAGLALGYLAASVGGGLVLLYLATAAVRRVRLR